MYNDSSCNLCPTLQSSTHIMSKIMSVTDVWNTAQIVKQNVLIHSSV